MQPHQDAGPGPRWVAPTLLMCTCDETNDASYSPPIVAHGAPPDAQAGRQRAARDAESPIDEVGADAPIEPEAVGVDPERDGRPFRVDPVDPQGVKSEIGFRVAS